MINIRPTVVNPAYRLLPSQTPRHILLHDKPIHFGQSTAQTPESEFSKFWKMSFTQKIGVILIGSPIMLCTLLLQYVLLRKHDIAFELVMRRGQKSTYDQNMDRFRAGLPPFWPTWDMGSIVRPIQTLIFSQIGSEGLVKATVHQDPDYKPYTPNVQRHRFHPNDEYELRDLNAHLKKYEIPEAPPKLSLLDRFLLKFYFKTKPAWELTEDERQRISDSFKDKRLEADLLQSTMLPQADA